MYDDKYPQTQTLDNGRYVFLEPIGGSQFCGRWIGEQQGPQARPVIISFRHLKYSRELDQLLRYDAPGIAPLLFIGSPDGYHLPQQHARRREVAVVEKRPCGEPVDRSGCLTPQEIVRLGIGLCDTIQECVARGSTIYGLRPETVFVTGKPGERYLCGTTPRSFVFLGMGDRISPFTNASYTAPEAEFISDSTPCSDAFSAALVMWFALLGEYAYEVPEHPHADHNIWEDIRRPFTGPPELGRLLEAVLVADVERRMKADELREELARLARAWNVDMPPFPPPGLAEP